MAKNTICLWYDGDAEEAATYYAGVFPDSAVTAVHRAPGDYPAGQQGDVLTVEFTICGIPCLGLNGGPGHPHSEAFSFQIATEDQAETDRYWNAIVDHGGSENACGWCRDRWGLSWQITPRVLTEAMAAGGDEARRAFTAMMAMRKIDVAVIQAARAGVMLQLFGHPFSSFCWKVLIALYENATPFDLRLLDPDHRDNDAEWTRRWPLRKMPVLVDGERTVFESDAIIEHLDRFHLGPVRLLPYDASAAVEARMMTRVADDYVMTPMGKLVSDARRPADRRDPFGVEEARGQLRAVYAWLDGYLTGRTWTAGPGFTIADCALAPALFYADWAEPIGDTHATLRAHRARLLARPSVARCVEAARPFRPYFPLGAPARD